MQPDPSPPDLPEIHGQIHVRSLNDSAPRLSPKLAEDVKSHEEADEAEAHIGTRSTVGAAIELQRDLDKHWPDL